MYNTLENSSYTFVFEFVKFQATAEANNLAAKAVSKEFYIRAMEQVKTPHNHRLSFVIVCLFFIVKHCGGDRPYIHPNQLEILHQEVRKKSLERFRSARKMGGEEMSQSYEQDLEDEITELYSKQIFDRDGRQY